MFQYYVPVQVLDVCGEVTVLFTCVQVREIRRLMQVLEPQLASSS